MERRARRDHSKSPIVSATHGAMSSEYAADRGEETGRSDSPDPFHSSRDTIETFSRQKALENGHINDGTVAVYYSIATRKPGRYVKLKQKGEAGV
ncbi:hypothetical protein FRB91_010607 [Serendipita sp. 411]|nr:hypothetical protein FRB91_010607 [Serendipita sp. 411]